MSEPVLTILGQDCSAYVSSWGRLEVVRKLKLSDASLFASKFTINLDNSSGFFTPGGAASIFPKVGWAGAEVLVSRDGLVLYDGFIDDLQVADDGSMVGLDLTSSLTKAADVTADMVEASINPAVAAHGLLVQAGLGDLLNDASFSVAAGYLRGHDVAIACPTDRGQTCLALASQIADVCSLDFILVRGVVYCQVLRPWDGSGLRQLIDGDSAHSLSPVRSDASSFANRVVFNYGAAQSVTVDNEASHRAERRPISISVNATDESKVQVATAATARFYGNLLLARTSPRRFLLNAILGPTFEEVLPGWRFPVTSESLGYSRTPFEVNEVQEDLDTDQISAILQTLEAAP